MQENETAQDIYFTKIALLGKAKFKTKTFTEQICLTILFT